MRIYNLAMDKELLSEAFEYTRRMPQNEREAFAVFCALNVIRLGSTEKVISNDYANGIAKPHVVRVVTYALEHPEINLIDNVYFDTSCKPNCIFIMCMGVQFSYHSVPLNNDTIISFIASEKNQPIKFDEIKKKPMAVELFEFAKEVLANNITDRLIVQEKVSQLSKLYV